MTGVLSLCILGWMLGSFGGEGLPPLDDIFAKNSGSRFARLLADQGRVHVDLRPLLQDHGNLSQQQVNLGFQKIHDRFRVSKAQIINSQGDTNFAWLEVHLQLTLSDRKSGREHRAVFAFHFKQRSSQLALQRWVLQDLY